MSIQYTIQSVTDAMERALRRLTKRAEYTDVDHLVGTWQEDPGFERAIADFERVDEDAWV